MLITMATGDDEERDKLRKEVLVELSTPSMVGVVAG